MKADEIINLKVIEVESGTSLGQVTGVLVDINNKRISAVAVPAGGVFGHNRYIPFENIVAIEHDVITIPSPQSLVERRNFPESTTIEYLSGRKVITEDGKDLGEMRTYEIDPKTGQIQAIVFGVNKEVLGGLWRTAGDAYTLPVELIKTLGENVIVDNSAPEKIGMTSAAPAS